MRLKHVVPLLTMLAVTLTACGGGEPVEPTTTPTPTPTPTTSTSATPTPTTRSTTTTPTPTPTPTTTEEEAAGPVDPLTGGEPSDNPVIAVKIENTAAGMPQYGIADADIVYTEQVEGGLVRLIAIFHSTLPEEVGAVRSIRSTDMQLLPSYGDPLLVASGGAPRQLVNLRNSGLRNAMEGVNGFWRSPVKYAPYNVHVNLQTLADDRPDLGEAQSPGFVFGAEDPRLADARELDLVDVSMRNGRTAFHYDDGRYQVYFNGAPYRDAVGGLDVFVDNVIVQHATNAPDGTIDPAGNPSYLTSTVGDGEFTLYRDGVAIDGTWHRAETADPTDFLAEDGEAVLLKPGKTWILLAPQGSTVHQG